ncbi:MAG: NAD(P)-dependent alcohol dehydrogenase [Chloroflexota bacterium]|nr:NAD(P)-dependent alcohol dehydrogenase [Chloroflexota bacterium]
MKAMIYTQYGSADVIRAAQMAQPTPKDNEVLIKIHAASINSADYRLMHGQPFMVRFVYGLFKPRHPILGSDIAGRIEAVGRAVTQFKVGDEVYGDLSNAGLGGFAEYVCAPESVIVRKPKSLSFEEAAAVPMAAITALQGVRDKGQVRVGQRVAINGASGGVGTFAVQIAKGLGAHVTAICSTRNVEAVRALGADDVIDYTQTDFTASGQHYDAIVGVNGYHPLAHYKRALTANGVYVMVGGSDAQIFQALTGSILSKQVQSLMVKPNAADLEYMTALLESGKVRPIIERCYPLTELADAMRYVESGHARGKVVMQVARA